MQFKFCPGCAQELVEKYIENQNRQICSNCGYIHYKNPTPAAAVILVEENKVLLVKRKFEPKAGYWTLPAGFIEYDETAELAAQRETCEETGLEVKIVKLYDVLGSCEKFTTPVVLVVYIAKRVGGTLVPGDDAIEADFFSLDKLPENIAFSSHLTALKKYINEERK